MALKQTENYKGLSVPDGYWQVHTVVLNHVQKRAEIRLALYVSADTASDINNMLSLYPETFIIEGSDYDTVFDPNGTYTTIMYNIFGFIMAYKAAGDEVPYFAGAKIVA